MSHAFIPIRFRQLNPFSGLVTSISNTKGTLYGRRDQKERLIITANRPQWLIFLSLFTSASTLICCALSALFVSLGMGAGLAGLVPDVPQLIWMSHHKGLTFGTAAIMLGISGGIIWRSRNLPYPVDPELRQACIRGRRWTKIIYGISVIIFLMGSSFAFVLPLVL